MSILKPEKVQVQWIPLILYLHERKKETYDKWHGMQNFVK